MLGSEAFAKVDQTKSLVTAFPELDNATNDVAARAHHLR